MNNSPPRPGSTPALLPPKPRRPLGNVAKEEIRRAFDLFDPSGSGSINAYESLKVTFRVLGFEERKDEIAKLVAESEREQSDDSQGHEGQHAAHPGDQTARDGEPSPRSRVPLQEKTLDFNAFLSIISKKMEEPIPRGEVESAFRLFGGTRDRPIGVANVAAVAEELGAKLTREEIEEMVLQALPPDQLRDTVEKLRRNKISPEAVRVTQEDFERLMRRRSE
ncbi:putative centrin 1 [Paratrimastix pyriformis]|uniref:Centrin 1 n=1 Tax=Paratrimastix pyriformis TaxID=342808 RepID=A0ABQ8UQ51_9EUKA|nr:putative centrin 1 [Paratrimastix pyriformis]